MRRSAFFVLVALVSSASGCRGASDRPGPDGGAAPLACPELPRRAGASHLLHVEWVSKTEAPELVAAWGAEPEVGARYALFGYEGYVGTVEATAVEHRKCHDDCPKFWVVTKWVSRSTAPDSPDPSRASFALEPVPPHPEKLRATDRPATPPFKGILAIDLDDDEGPDIVVTRRICDCAISTETNVRVGHSWEVAERARFDSVFAKYCD